MIVYFSEKIKFSRQNNIEIGGIETMWFEVKPDYKKSFLLCFVYRPPKSTIDWIDDFEKELGMAVTINSDIILLGDFNMNFKAPSKPPQKWLNVLETFNLQQLIVDATRVTKDTSTLIDHIYVSNLDKVQESHVSNFAISDHYPICLTRKEVNKDKKNSHSTITYRNFKKFDQNEFLLDLQSTPFYKIEFEDNPSVCLQLFYDMLNKVLDKHAPVVEKRVKKERQPDWYNSEIIYARNMRDKYNALGLWSEYRFWRNKTKQIIENSKKNYYKNMVKDSKDSKSLWKCLHSLNPKFKKSPHELATDENNTTTNDKKSIADTFNNFFTSCAEELREQRDITSVDKADFNNLSKFIKNQLKQQKHEKFTIPPIKINKLFDELIKLDVNKSLGTDNIGPQNLKKKCPMYFLSSHIYIQQNDRYWYLSFITEKC